MPFYTGPHEIRHDVGLALLQLACSRLNWLSQLQGSRPSWALVGAGCNNQLQPAQGHNPQPELALVLPAIGCCILLLATSAQDDLDPLRLVLLVFSQSSTASFVLVVGHHLQLALVVFFLCQLAHLLMCTHWCTLQLALCGGIL